MRRLPGWHDVTCLYCFRITGQSPDAGRKTVCGYCQFRPRDEARELDAGMRPWARPDPLPLIHGMLNHVSVPDEIAAIAQQKWDEDQERIKQSNAEHRGNTLF